MDILELLESVKREILIKRHPLADEELSLRFAYAVGVGMSANSDGPMNENMQAAMKSLAAGLLIPEEQIIRVLSVATTPDKVTIISVLNELNKREHQYLFLLDISAMANRDGATGEKEQKVIKQFAAIFKMRGSELAFWRELEEVIIFGDFTGSEALFQEIYRRKEFTETGVSDLATYRALAYFLNLEAIQAELARLENELGCLEIEYEEIVAKTAGLGKRPVLRRSDPKKYFEAADKISGFENGALFAALLSVLHHKAKDSNDDLAGEKWDNANTVAKKMELLFLLRIGVAKTRRDLLVAAIDEMYINNPC